MNENSDDFWLILEIPRNFKGKTINSDKKRYLNQYLYLAASRMRPPFVTTRRGTVTHPHPVFCKSLLRPLPCRKEKELSPLSHISP